MWATILKYLGAELGKTLIVALQDWFYKFMAKREQEKKNEKLAKIEKLLIAKEVARTTGDIANLDRITRELYKLQGNRD